MVEVSTLTYNLGNFGFWMCSTGWFKQNCFRSHCSPIVGGSTPNGKYHLKFLFWLFAHLPYFHCIHSFAATICLHLLLERNPLTIKAFGGDFTMEHLIGSHPVTNAIALAVLKVGQLKRLVVQYDSTHERSSKCHFHQAPV